MMAVRQGSGDERVPRHGEADEAGIPFVAIAERVGDAWSVHDNNPAEKHEGEERCGEPRPDLRGNGEPCRHQGTAGEPRKEEVEGNPVRDEGGNPGRGLEVQGAEDNEGDAKEAAADGGEADGEGVRGVQKASA